LPYSGTAGSSAGNVDLLSVAIHELGHALGLDSGYIPISAPLPFAGAHILGFYTAGVLDGSQGNLGYVAMQPYITTDELLLISQADLLAVCEVSQPTDCVTGGTDTPKPATSGLIFTSGIAVFAFRRRLALQRYRPRLNWRSRFAR
jgi:hypothetical protein